MDNNTYTLDETWRDIEGYEGLYQERLTRPMMLKPYVYNTFNHKLESSEDKEVLELLNNTLNDDESYEDINNNINVSVSINNSCIAAYVEGINSVLNSINKDIDYELLQDVIKDDIVKYIDIVVK